MERNTMKFNAPAEHRQFPRASLNAPYTQIHARRLGAKNFNLHGHAYDISAGGMRFELDRAFEAGEMIEVHIELPGMPCPRIAASGQVVRLHDPDDPGPVRMAMAFTTMATPRDRFLLDSYVRHRAAG